MILAGPFNTASNKHREIARSLTHPEAREAFVEEHILQGIAFQVAAMREARGWTQSDLATEVGVSQSQISKLEDPDGPRPNVSTLLRVALALDVGPFSAIRCIQRVG